MNSNRRTRWSTFSRIRQGNGYGIIVLLLALIFVPGIVWDLSHAQEGEPGKSEIRRFWIEKEVHFQGVDGWDVLIQPGVYWLNSQDKNQLHIVGEPDTLGLVKAKSFNHDKDIQVPTPLFFENDDGIPCLFLFLSDGKGLEALGSYTGVWPRGEQPALYQDLSSQIQTRGSRFVKSPPRITSFTINRGREVASRPVVTLQFSASNADYYRTKNKDVYSSWARLASGTNEISFTLKDEEGLHYIYLQVKGRDGVSSLVLRTIFIDKPTHIDRISPTSGYPGEAIVLDLSNAMAKDIVTADDYEIIVDYGDFKYAAEDLKVKEMGTCCPTNTITLHHPGDIYPKLKWKGRTQIQTRIKLVINGQSTNWVTFTLQKDRRNLNVERPPLGSTHPNLGKSHWGVIGDKGDDYWTVKDSWIVTDDHPYGVPWRKLWVPERITLLRVKARGNGSAEIVSQPDDIVVGSTIKVHWWFEAASSANYWLSLKWRPVSKYDSKRLR